MNKEMLEFLKDAPFDEGVKNRIARGVSFNRILLNIAEWSVQDYSFVNEFAVVLSSVSMKAVTDYMKQSGISLVETNDRFELVKNNGEQDTKQILFEIYEHFKGENQLN